MKQSVCPLLCSLTYCVLFYWKDRSLAQGNTRANLPFEPLSKKQEGRLARWKSQRCTSCRLTFIRVRLAPYVNTSRPVHVQARSAKANATTSPRYGSLARCWGPDRRLGPVGPVDRVIRGHHWPRTAEIMGVEIVSGHLLPVTNIACLLATLCKRRRADKVNFRFGHVEILPVHGCFGDNVIAWDRIDLTVIGE